MLQGGKEKRRDLKEINVSQTNHPVFKKKKKKREGGEREREKENK